MNDNLKQILQKWEDICNKHGTVITVTGNVLALVAGVYFKSKAISKINLNIVAKNLPITK